MSSPGAADKARESRRLRAFLRRRMEEQGRDVSSLASVAHVEREDVEACLSGRHGSRMVDFFVVASVLGVDLSELFEAVGREVPFSWKGSSFQVEAGATASMLSQLSQIPVFHFWRYPGGDFHFSLGSGPAYRMLSRRLAEIDKALEARDGAALVLLELFVQITRSAEALGIDLTLPLHRVRFELPWRVEEAVAGAEAVEGLRFSVTSKRWIRMLIEDASPTIRDQVYRALEVDRKRRKVEARLWKEVVSEVSLKDEEEKKGG